MAGTAVIGIDIGASESLVAYVGKGVIDLAQNELSRRASPSLVGFTDRGRLLGDAALAQIRSNAKNSCRNFKHLLGRSHTDPDVENEHFWSTCKLTEATDGTAGYDVMYKSEATTFSAVQITAMFLTRLKEITENWCQAKVVDAVISVPSYFTDVHRIAMINAAEIAGISVLKLLNEHTATALAYGIYRSNDFEPEKPTTVAFCSLGHSIFSVAVVQFFRGKLMVLNEKSDKVGGRDMDECLMREFAKQFKAKHGSDPLSNKKAAFKLEDAVTKTKKILSANSEAPVNIECLMDDEDFASNINRDDFENMCKPMMARVQAVFDAVKSGCGVPVEQIDIVEVVGGASRVPWFKKMCSDAFGGKELSTTMNADESVARGCALQAAILSPQYKVRDFKIEDKTPFGRTISWTGMNEHGACGLKSANIFPTGSYMNVVKMLTFYRKEPFEVTATYSDDAVLSKGTRKELGTFRIEVPAQPEQKKIKLHARLTLNGTFALDTAELLEDEEYEEMVREQREVPADESMQVEAAKTDGDTPMADVEQKPGEEKDSEANATKYEWVDVMTKRIRTKRTNLKIAVSGTLGLDGAELQRLMDYETAIQTEMREVIETDEKRNDLESFIFNMRDKVSETGMYGAFISEKERETINEALMKAEDWLYDTATATKADYVEKLQELKERTNPVVWRSDEDGMREEGIKSVSDLAKQYRSCAENPGYKYGHIVAEKRQKIIVACNDLERWLTEKRLAQEKLTKADTPVLTGAEMEKKKQELAKMADEILREPKPPPPPRPTPPPKVEKKEEKKEEKKDAKADSKKESASKEATKADPQVQEEDTPKQDVPKGTPLPKDGPENMDVD